MTDSLDNKPTATYYLIAAVFLVWNLIGVLFYYMQVTMTPEVMAENFSPQQIAFLSGIPVWATAAHAIAVNAGVLGGLFLLLRRSWAVPTFIVSLLAVVLQDVDAFLLRDGLNVWGTSGTYLPAIVIAVGIVEVLYSRAVNAKGWLR